MGLQVRACHLKYLQTDCGTGTMSAMNLILKESLDGVEWEEVAEVYRQAFGHPMNASRIESIFAHSYRTRLAVVDGHAVGGVYAVSDGDLDAAIYGLAVHPDFQRRGIGSALMRSIIGALPSHAAIVLTADAPHLVAMYRKLGFSRLKIAMALRYPLGTTE